MRLVNQPLRMCVQDIFKGQGGSFSVAGRMEAGDIQNGDRVMVMPSAEYATVKGNIKYCCNLWQLSVLVVE